eukprot:TRINITY_DN56089_c0_g1_i1.p1 TRINITY_DN56089_c0_g1~~TRINITY_DN56089_c0_g1_i1.p1  ORF type:complete len:360 (-),score=4.23 TRINITY_DN56089_c0_g1_i1:125-1204(-)
MLHILISLCILILPRAPDATLRVKSLFHDLHEKVTDVGCDLEHGAEDALRTCAKVSDIELVVNDPKLLRGAYLVDGWAYVEALLSDLRWCFGVHGKFSGETINWRVSDAIENLGRNPSVYLSSLVSHMLDKLVRDSVCQPSTTFSLRIVSEQCRSLLCAGSLLLSDGHYLASITAALSQKLRTARNTETSSLKAFATLNAARDNLPTSAQTCMSTKGCCLHKCIGHVRLNAFRRCDRAADVSHCFLQLNRVPRKDGNLCSAVLEFSPSGVGKLIFRVPHSLSMPLERMLLLLLRQRRSRRSSNQTKRTSFTSISQILSLVICGFMPCGLVYSLPRCWPVLSSFFLVQHDCQELSVSTLS